MCDEKTKVNIYNKFTTNGKELFHLKNLWQKSLIVFAGPLSNYLLTICISPRESDSDSCNTPDRVNPEPGSSSKYGLRLLHTMG